MLVIGIDPGTAITGYGLVREENNGDLTVVDYGVIETPAKMPMPERKFQIHRFIEQKEKEKEAIEAEQRKAKQKR